MLDSEINEIYFLQYVPYITVEVKSVDSNRGLFF